MYCSNCGKAQATNDTRFCVKCGLPLAAAKQLLSGNQELVIGGSKRSLTPKVTGVLQGLAIFPTAVGAWFVLDIFYESVLGQGLIGGLFAMLTLFVVVSILRIGYALFFEEGRSKMSPAITETTPPQYSLDGLNMNERSLREHAEGDVHPPSVVDSTTRKLTVPR